MTGNEQLYLDATNEAEGKNRDPALWAKVMALSEGDEAKAKYKYINLRVESLHREKERKEKEQLKASQEARREECKQEIDSIIGNEEQTLAALKNIKFTTEKRSDGAWTVYGPDGENKYLSNEHDFYKFAHHLLLTSTQTDTRSYPEVFAKEDPRQRVQSGAFDPAVLGTKWLKFWNYFSLPVGGVLGLLMSLDLPAIGIIMAPLAILQFVVAYGLHYRKLWAWQWNWVLVIITYIGMLIPAPIPGSHGGTAGLAVQFVIRLILGSLIFLWPNHVYWKKRKELFS